MGETGVVCKCRRERCKRGIETMDRVEERILPPTSDGLKEARRLSIHTGTLHTYEADLLVSTPRNKMRRPGILVRVLLGASDAVATLPASACCRPVGRHCGITGRGVGRRVKLIQNSWDCVKRDVTCRRDAPVSRLDRMGWPVLEEKRRAQVSSTHS